MNVPASQNRAPSSIASIAIPLDLVRAAVLRVAGRTGRVFLSDRAARVGLYAAFGLVVALAIACVAPVWAFALGPVVLGVPHLVADVRYLVVRPRLHERRPLVLATGVPLVLATIFQSPALGLSAGIGAILFATGERVELSRLRIALLGALGVAIAFAARSPRTASLVLLHGHNALAVVVFLVAFARSRRVGAVVALGAVVATIALLGGVFDSVFLSAVAGSGPRTGLSFAGMMDILAPNITDPVLAMRVAVLFVFAQGFHYVIWLRVVPEEARERAGIRSFGSSIKALEREIGLGVVVVTALLAALLLARAGTSLEAARVLYLRASGFHGYLEIAFLLFWLSARRSSEATRCPSA